MAVKTLLPLCLLVSSVIATPIQIRSSPVTLPIAIKINSTGGPQALVNRDRARARALFAHGQAKAQGESLANVPVPVTDAVVNIHSFPFNVHVLVKLILFPASKSTPRQLVSVLVHTRSSWTLGVPIPGLALDSPIILVQIPKTQGLPCQYSMAAEVSQARNASVFNYCSHQSSTFDDLTECVL